MKSSRFAKIFVLLWIAPYVLSCGRPVVDMKPTAKLKEIQISCEQNQGPANVYLPCEAVGVFSDGSASTLNESAEWSSSDPSVLLAGLQGGHSWVRGVGPGEATITAQVGAVSGTYKMFITNATPLSIAVTPANQTFQSGAKQAFSGVAIFSDSTYYDVTRSADWLSLDLSVAQITSGLTNPGLFTALAAGNTTISAAFGGVVGSAPAVVRAKDLWAIQVTPATINVIQGLSTPLTATGIFTDFTTADITSTVVWAVVDGSLGSISNVVGSSGQFTGFQPGTTSVMASTGGFTASATVTVINPILLSIDVTPANASTALGTTQQLSAMGHYSDGTDVDISGNCIWVSSDTNIATVSNVAGQKGLVGSHSQGNVTISAVFGGITGQTYMTIGPAVLTSLTITPSNTSVAKGLTQQYIAIGTYSDTSTADLTNDVTWTVVNGAIGSLSNAPGSVGLFTATQTGTTQVRATLSNITGTTNVTVSSAIVISIALTPNNSSIADGTSQQLTATATYSDGSTVNVTSSATWSSSNPTIATVNNTAGAKGSVTGQAQGMTTISATSGGATGQTFITITAPTLSSISVTPANRSIAKGLTQQHIATGNYSDGSSVDITSSVTWSSGSGAVASVSTTAGSKGLTTGMGVGTTTIIATLGGISGQTSIVVTAAVLQSIVVGPSNTTIFILGTVQFTATGHYTDGTTANLTSSVTWSSTNGLTATISNSAGTKGRASGVGLGTTTITATEPGGLSGSTLLTGIL